MNIYLKDNSAKFHLHLFWNNRAFGFLNRLPQHEQEQGEYDIGSVS